MRYPEFHFRYEWRFQASPEALWPLVSDTNRFGKDTGAPSVDSTPTPSGRLANARRHLSGNRFGMTFEWDEEPYEWVRPFRFGVTRRYLRGPMAEYRTQGDLTPLPNGGTHLVYQVWMRPRTLFGFLTVPLQMRLTAQNTFTRAFQHYERLALRTLPAYSGYTPTRVDLPQGARERLAQGRQALLDEGLDADLVTQLIDMIEHADDLTVAQMRPYALADAWERPRRTILELCLFATRVGLLDFRWELLCPLCRGARQQGSSLRDVRAQIHCETCNINYTVNFDRSVELTFRPNAAIRPIEVGAFCIGGPQVTPHVMAQQLLLPSQARVLSLPLEEGRYRIRTMELPGGQYLSATPTGANQVTIPAADEGWPPEELQLSLHPSLQLCNQTSQEQLFILERMAWSDQAATAADVTGLQLFRDLFADEALRPGDQIDVGSLTIVFTDLRGSTRLYREIGDASAFGRVMSHFDILRDAVAAENGVLIKTIGDAIMATFRQPAAALRAMLHAQAQLATLADDDVSLYLKAGIHQGPCIAVTLNGRLDYFGSTVNMAARLEGLSTGQDVVISPSIITDPEVGQLLANGTLTATPFTTTLKGFDQESFELWRIAPAPSPILQEPQSS